MSVDEIMDEFERVYLRCVSLDEKNGGSLPSGELLSMVHMVFARKDAEFERKMAMEMSDNQKMEAVYGRGYSSEDYTGEE